MKEHPYAVHVTWNGNLGTGTSGYAEYSRNHSIKVDQKVDIQGSSDPAFRGDITKHNPEEMFVSSIASCHMLWFLHLAVTKGIVVVEYTDYATGVMIEREDGSGYFESVTLHPVVTIQDPNKMEEVNELHTLANNYCFIANSLNFTVHHSPLCVVSE